MTLPAPALQLDRAIVNAVTAAATTDVDAFAETCAVLDARGGDAARRVLSGVLRPVLETMHGDGVDGDDLADLIEATVAAQGWVVRLDPLALAVVLTGAFGIEIAAREELPHEVKDADVTRHAVLLVAHLVHGPKDLRRWLDVAWSEIARQDTND
jgi:hypothetical protein